MNYENFADYWDPIAVGEGPLGKYVAGLDPARREKAADAVRAAYESGQPDGPRSFSKSKAHDFHADSSACAKV